MTASNREACFRHTGAAEGKFSNRNKHDDPGGATMYGVTAVKLGEFRGLGRPATVEEVRALTKREAEEVYEHDFWRPVRGDDLPEGVDLAVFDYGINSGPGKAVRELQRVLGVSVDGAVGSQTLDALKAADLAKVINDYQDARLAFMRSLSNWSANKNGWTTRVASIRRAALAMAAGAKPPKPVELPAAATAKAPTTAVAATRTPEGKGAIIGTVAATATAAKAVGVPVEKVVDVVVPHAAKDGFVGQMAICLLVLVLVGAALVVGYQVWRRSEEQKGHKMPPTLIGWVAGLVSPGVPA